MRRTVRTGLVADGIRAGVRLLVIAGVGAVAVAPMAVTVALST